jgi:RNA polymerase sigma-70 factor (ECF subfamily)
MDRPNPDQRPSAPRTGRFAATRWSVVLAAGRDESPRAAEALEQLCRVYWYPLYAFVRRQGHGPEDAQDLTQAFFTRLIAKRDLAAVDRAKGRFRSFLLAAMRHFLANEWDRARAAKRGGGVHVTSFDAISAEARYAREPVDPETPERIFERRWALAMLDEVLGRLRDEYESRGQGEQFEALKGMLGGGGGEEGHAATGLRLGMSEGAVKVAAHRLRRRYRDLLRREIATTVASPDDVDDELRHLFAVLSGGECP